MSVRQDQVNVNVVINGYEKGTTLKQMEGNLRQMRREVGGLAIGTKEWTDKMNAIKKLDGDIKSLKGSVRQVGQQVSTFKDQLMQVAGPLAAAFSVQQVIAFGKECITAFTDAEKNANALKFALVNIGGESGSAVDKLIKQSEQLQEVSIFSDDDIQKAQHQLAVFGLTAEEIEKLTPQILDMATASGQDLGSATDTVIKGINGQTKGLKMLGIDYKDTGSKAENLAILTDKLGKFQGAAGDATNTAAGKAAVFANRWDNVKETIGGYLVGAGGGLLDWLDVLTGKVSMAEKVVRDFEAVVSGQLSARTELFNKFIETLGTDEEKVIAYNQEISNLNKQRENLAKSKMDSTRYAAAKDAILKDIEYLKKERDLLTAPKKGGLGSGAEGDGGGFGGNSPEVDKLKKLTAELDKIRHDQEMANMSAHQREVEKVRQKYDELRELAQGHADKLAEINQLESNELAALDQKRADQKKAQYIKEKEEEDKQNDEMLKKRRELSEKIHNALISDIEAEIEATKKKYETLIAEATLAGLSTVELTAEMNAQLEFLRKQEAERQLAIFRAILKEKTDLIDQEAELWHNVGTIGENILDLMGDKMSQFAEWQKRLAIFQIAIDTASAISKAIATGSAVGITPIEKAIAITGNIALVLANMVKVKEILKGAGSVPKMEKGGILSGSLHSEGGLPVYDRRTGRQVAEMEGGEAVLSRATYSNNRALVDTLLDASQNRGGAPVSPFGYIPKGVSFNSARAAVAMDKMAYPLSPGAASLQSGSAGPLAEVLAQHLRVAQELRSLLAAGISAKLSYDRLNQDQAAIDTAKRSGQIGG